MAPKTASLQPSTGDKSLSAEDIQNIRKTWDIVKQDIKTAGYDLFIKWVARSRDFKSSLNATIVTVTPLL